MAQDIFPTKGNLMMLKKNISLAKLGFDLLDRKRNVLMREMMKRIEEVAIIESDISSTFVEAYEALQRANVMHGIDNLTLDYVPIDDGFRQRGHSIMGVDLPTTHGESQPLIPYYGMQGSSQEMDRAFCAFNKVKELSARLAGIDNSVYRLAVAIKKTKRRANMLDNIMIPKFDSNIRFIQGVLEEREREEFSRLKVIKRKSGR